MQYFDKLKGKFKNKNIFILKINNLNQNFNFMLFSQFLVLEPLIRDFNDLKNSVYSNLSLEIYVKLNKKFKFYGWQLDDCI